MRTITMHWFCIASILLLFSSHIASEQTSDGEKEAGPIPSNSGGIQGPNSSSNEDRDNSSEGPKDFKELGDNTGSGEYTTDMSRLIPDVVDKEERRIRRGYGYGGRGRGRYGGGGYRGGGYGGGGYGGGGYGGGGYGGGGYGGGGWY